VIARTTTIESSTRPRLVGRGILDRALPKFLKRAVVAQTVLILVAVWGYAGWRLAADREQTLQTGRQQLRTISAGLHAHVEAILNDAVGSSVAASNEVKSRGGLDQLSDPQLSELLGRYLTGGDYVRALLLATPQRFAQVERDRSAVLGAVPPEWLQAVMRDYTGDTYVGRPIAIRSGSVEQAVPIAMRVSGGENGMWAGVLMGLASLDRLYSRMRFDDGVLGIFVPGGDVLVRVPPLTPNQISPEVNARRTQLTERQSDLTDEAFFEIAGPVTGRATMFYSRRIAGYPLVVSAGRARDSILATWRERTVAVIGVLAGITVLLIALTLLLRHYIARLERRESHYRTLFNNTAVSVFLMSGDTFLEANATTYRMFRVPPNVPFEGLHPWELSPERQPDGRESIQLAHERLQSAQSLGQLKFRWTHKRMDTHEPFPAEVSLSSMQLGDQSLMLAIVHDLTELEGARSDLEQANAKLAALNTELESRVLERTAALQHANMRLALTNQELEAFTASASHDLRSPLGSIAGQAGLLREDLQPLKNETIRRRLDRIAEGVKRCGEIIDGLLSLAKLSRQELMNERIDVSALAQAIVEDLKQQYPEHAVDCTIAAGIVLDADPRLLKSLLSNLLDNAWKYTTKSPTPTVRLRCTVHDGAQEFSVSDNGAGFEMAYAHKIFEPFQRMHSMAEFPGLGIGLATVARIVQRYGGKIWVESAPGQGTTFHFTLPAAAIAERREQSPRARTTESRS
jgi:signal transduction histidine kinase